MEAVLVHYHEVGLKGGNRPLFIGRLARNLAEATRGLGVRRVEKLTGRLLAPLEPWADRARVLERVGCVFGVANYSPARWLPLDAAAIREAGAEMLAPKVFRTFRVETRRAFKGLPFQSQELDREVGSYIQARRHIPVDLTSPEATLYIEVLPGGALLYTEKLPGPGGLPVGVSGRVVCLLSGGIDSPVAAYRMMKRGCQAVLVHFHSVPYLSRASIEKVTELAALLNRYQGRTALYLVPLGELQREIVLATPPPPRVVLYRRFMARIGEAIAAGERAGALVTGESLGQVASQTLPNLATVEGAVALPILRPLIGMDKLEIIREAQAIGTYEVSIEPDQDCCTLFTPKHPAVRTSPEELQALEARLDVPGMVERALAGAEVTLYRGERRERGTAPAEGHAAGEGKEPGAEV